MSDLQFWLTIFVGLTVVSGVVCFMSASRPEWIGLIAVPLVTSAAVTIYILAFDSDPQAPVFLVAFYFLASVAGALGSLIGRALHRRITRAA